MSTLVDVFLLSVGAYLCVGLAFALPFLARGAGQLDASARGATWGFRLIVAPGVVALWPWLAWRWSRGSGRSEHNAHRDAARNPEEAP